MSDKTLEGARSIHAHIGCEPSFKARDRGKDLSADDLLPTPFTAQDLLGVLIDKLENVGGDG